MVVRQYPHKVKDLSSTTRGRCLSAATLRRCIAMRICSSGALSQAVVLRGLGHQEIPTESGAEEWIASVKTGLAAMGGARETEAIAEAIARL